MIGYRNNNNKEVLSMAKVRMIWVTGFVLLVALSFPAFSQEPIKIGINLSTTGPVAKFGVMDYNSIMMAFEDLGLKKIDGREIVFVSEDNRGDPPTAKSAEEKLISKDKVDLIIGGYTSATTVAMTGTAEDLGCPHIIVNGSADKITEKPNKWIFSGPRVPSSHYGDALWGLVDEVIKPKKVALYYENTEFGTSSAKALREGFKERKIELVFDQPYESGAVTFKPMLSKVKRENPDMVMAVSYLTDAILLAKQSAEIRLNVPIYMGYAAGYTMPEFVDNAGKNVNYICTTTNWDPNAPWPGAKKYYEAYLKKYNAKADYHGAQGYAAMEVAIDALKKAKRPITRDSIREALIKTNLMTVMGKIEHKEWKDKLGHHYYNQGLPLTYVMQWQNKELKVVWPLDAKTANLIFPAPPYEKR
jgi:branched-chain amino acid transport system substrate-binding protein